MKKILALVLVAGMVAFVACGPSKEDQEKKEKAKQDSIKAAEKAKTEADSLAKLEEEKAKEDQRIKDSIEEAKNKPKGTGNYNNPKGNQGTQTTTTVTTQPKGVRPGATKK